MLSNCTFSIRRLTVALTLCGGVSVAALVLPPAGAQPIGGPVTAQSTPAPAAGAPAAGAPAAGANTGANANIIVIDDFENGVGSWSRNDKFKTDNPAAGVLLVDVAATRPSPGGVPGSQGAGLFAFKSAKGAWASASIGVDGARWAQIGAQRLSFWLNAGGELTGVDLVLRGRYKAADGSLKEESFALPQPIRLDTKQWRKVVIPLTDFRGPSGAVPGRLSGVYMLQFVQRGEWDSRFFIVDQLQVEGNGVPIPQAPVPTPPPPPAPVVTAAPANPTALVVKVDYLRVQGRLRPAANVSVAATLPPATAGGAAPFPLTDSQSFRAALQTLAPRFMRLDAGTLTELTDSSRPTFDFTRLQSAVNQARAIGCEPLVALSAPVAWGLDERGYGVYAAQAAGTLNARTAKPVRYWELAVGTSDAATDDVEAVAFYNKAYTALKSLSAEHKVGGMTTSSGRAGALAALLKDATGLDFLAVQFYAAYTGAPPAPSLFSMAREVKNLRAAGAALDRSRFKNAPLFVTQANLNAARAEIEGVPADGRTVQMISAAWWATFVGNAARVSDQIFHNDAGNPEWGLLDENAKAYPAYYVLWMWNTFFPVGSERVEAVPARDDVVAIAVNTATAHNLMLANTTDGEIPVRIEIRGFPVLRAARIRVIEDPLKGVRFEDLPKSPFQNVTLKPYAVAVLQFTEPPKR